MTFGIGMLALLIQIFWPKVSAKIPGSLIAILVTTLIVQLGKLPVATIGDLYTIKAGFPKFAAPQLSFALVKELISPAFTIAILASIESLLSCVVSDGMIGGHHRSNAELVGQGVGNIMSSLFGGIPATGAIARTAANIKNGGRTPIAGMVHSVTLLLILVVLMPYAALIPMPAIAAILFMVAYNMCGWREFVNLCKTAPKSDILVLVLTFVLTVVFDLVVAIEVGLILTCILFMKRMSDVTEVSGWKYVEPEDDPEGTMMNVPKNTVVYEITGPMFFGAADKLLKIAVQDNAKCLILRMRSVNAIDSTAMRNFERLYKECQKKKVTLIFSHVNSQPMSIMHKAGFYEEVGADNFCAHINDAMKRAQDLQ